MIILGILLLYVIAQSLYSGYFLLASKKLSASTFPKSLTLGDNKGPALKLFISGDSVAAGVGASTFEKSVSGRIAWYLAKDHTVLFQNEAVSGAAMSQLLTMPLPKERQDVIVLIVSSNDLFRFSEINEFKKNTEKALKRYSPQADKLILVGPGRVFDGEALPYFLRMYYRFKAPQYAHVLTSLIKNNPNVIYIDPTTADFYKGNYGPTTAADKFHPNDEGHRLWFDLIRPAL